LNVGISDEDRSSLARALAFAADLYGGKLLGTGEPAYEHAVGTARNVAELRLDADARAAGLLFAVPAYLPAAEEALTESFGTAIAELADELAGAGIRAEISGRPKHLYSIYTKMRAKSLDFSQIHDVSGLRVLVDEAKDCYTVLGVVHNLWAPIPREFDDYISRPKANLYRSLHTAVIGPQGKALEVQIRTREMHRDAE